MSRILYITGSRVSTTQICDLRESSLFRDRVKLYWYRGSLLPSFPISSPQGQSKHCHEFRVKFIFILSLSLTHSFFQQFWYVAQAAKNSWSSCLRFQSAEIVRICHHVHPLTHPSTHIPIHHQLNHPPSAHPSTHSPNPSILANIQVSVCPSVLLQYRNLCFRFCFYLERLPFVLCSG